MANNDFSFKIVAHVGTVENYPTGWSKEVNIVSWNDGAPKLDIRDWDSEHEHMSRGITLTADEMQRVIDSVQARDDIGMLKDMNRPARTNDYER